MGNVTKKCQRCKIPKNIHCYTTYEWNKSSGRCLACGKKNYQREKIRDGISDKPSGWAWRGFLVNPEKIALMQDK